VNEAAVAKRGCPVWWPIVGATTVLLLVSCGGKSAGAQSGALSPVEHQDLAQDSAYAPMESVPTPITQLDRRDVVAAVDAGLGRFLQKFEIEPSLTERGEFTGFRIVRIVDPAPFTGLGIGPGDVVTSINQQPIERPNEAYEAFVSLRAADSLEIDYLRGGRLMRLSLPIIGEPVPVAEVPKDKVISTPVQ
jgi:C-terminal processing protease CtpA/Prc